jgi:hypothetical protein
MAEDPKQTLKELEDSLKSIKQSGQDIVNEFGSSLTNSLQRSIIETDRLIEGFKKGDDITKDINKSFNDVTRSQISLTNKSINLEKQLQKALKQNNSIRQEEIINELASVKLQQKLNEDVLNQLNTLRNVNEEKKKQFSLSNISKKSMDGISSSLEKSLGFSLSLTSIFGFMLKAAFDIDSQIVELGRSLGVSREQATAIREEFYQFAQNAEDGFTTTKKLLQAQTDLSKQLGIAVAFNKEDLKTFAKLTELYGLSSEEAGKLSKLSAITGKSVEQYKNSILKGSFYAQQATKTHFDQREILKTVANLSDGILVKFQGNPKALAQAVVEAKKLGTNLETIDKIGESLLNFESSLESELKAELLTSKQINLEKARYASLTGNQLDLTREISSQVGSLADFQNLNVIAQKSLAEAFGLSRDEMSGMLMQQEAINKYGDKAAELNAQQLEDFNNSGLSLDAFLTKQSEQLKIQDNFNAAIENLKDVLGTIASGPLMSLLKGFATLLQSSTLIKSAIVAITAISFGKTLASLATMATSLGLSAAGAIATASAITLGIGIAAVLVGIAAAMGAFSSAKDEATQSVQDGIAPPGKGPFTITDSFGATAVTAKGDGIAVSPNISRSNEINNTSIDLTPMITAINQVKSAVDRLYSKDTSINMDGKKVGTTLTQGSYKVA